MADVHVGAYKLLHDHLTEKEQGFVKKFNEIFAGRGMRLIYKEVPYTELFNDVGEMALDEGIYRASLGWKLRATYDETRPILTSWDPEETVIPTQLSR